MLIFLPLAAFTVTYNDTSFYVVQTLVPYLGRNEVHLFTGDAPEDQTATVTGSCNNCSVKPYSMTWSPIYHSDPHSMAFYRNISTTFTKVDGSGDVSLDGKAFVQNISGTFILTQLQWLEGSRFAAFMVPGVPPPPPGPKCADATDKDSCDKIAPTGGSSCAWCVSGDSVHSLCFDSSAEPPSPWKCDQ